MESAVLERHTSGGAEIINGYWCALKTWGGRQHQIATTFDKLGIEYALPCQKVTRLYAKRKVEVDVPVCGAWIFAAVPAKDDLFPLLDVRYVRGYELIADWQQERFSKQLADMQKALAIDPHLEAVEWQQVGVKVKVKSGPFMGLEGEIISRRGRQILHVALEFMNSAIVIENVEAHQLEPL